MRATERRRRNVRRLEMVAVIAVIAAVAGVGIYLWSTPAGNDAYVGKAVSQRIFSTSGIGKYA